ncbi:hypothetical protein [Nocardia brasiliensis]|uniref:hypothetical protein n=1 Tax=Nocardia brasiliensis TaxID=37326 RepID=UPI00189514AE|nr:hypothetical protein [Nocardia brasiliensis]MBF6127186.1 hypothetical protein [Nocardia brasiliensis]
MDIIDVIVTFAKTGQVGALRLGLRGDELVAALREVGVPLPASDDFADFLQREESVEVHVEDGELRMVGLDRIGWREPEFRLPAKMNAPGAVVLTMDRVLEILAEADCPWHPYPPLTIDPQISIETAAAVHFTFAPRETGGEYLLYCMYASTPSGRPHLDE